jgi:hypothetical protein
MSTGLVTFIHCFSCSAETIVVGPAAAPAVEYPGWRIDALGFYNPNSPGHQCPRCQRRAWTAYCANIVAIPEEGIDECEWCLGDSGIVIDAPKLWEPDFVVAQLHRLGVLCRGRNDILDVEEIGDNHYDEVQREVAVRL